MWIMKYYIEYGLYNYEREFCYLIYKEESVFVSLLFMHLDHVGANATKRSMACSFIQGKIKSYVLIQNVDLRGSY